MELGDGEAMPTIESEGAKGGGGCGRGRAGKGEGTADSTPADVSAVQKESQPGPELVPNGTDSQPAPSRGRNNRKPRGGRGGGAVSGEGPGGNENAARPAGSGSEPASLHGTAAVANGPASDSAATNAADSGASAEAKRGRRRGRGRAVTLPGDSATTSASEDGKDVQAKMTRPLKAINGPDATPAPATAGAPGGEGGTEDNSKENASRKQRRKKNKRDKGDADTAPANGGVGTNANARAGGGGGAMGAAGGNAEFRGSALDDVDRVSKGDTVGVMNMVKPEEATAKDYYFDSYAHHGIHEEMLKDHVRTSAYRDAMFQNKETMEGKVVLDVGCGTGILSMFAARAGAKHVYAVECSGIIHLAKQIVSANGLDDKITLIHGKIEDVDLPVDKVDMIISEWMGHALLHESMLESVIVARDRFLKEGGLMLPDKANIWMVGVEDMNYRRDKMNWWKDVYGFDMSSITPSVQAEPIVDMVPLHSICTKTCQLRSFDLHTATKADLSFKAPFRLTVARNDYLTAWVLYFEVGFSKLPTPVWINTSPKAQATHWRQAVFYLDKQLLVSKNEAVSGEVSVQQNKRNPRDLDFTVSYAHQGKAEGKKTGRCQYRMR